MSVRRIVPNINAADPSAAKPFYEGVLGLETAMDMGWIITFASPSNPTAQISVVASDTRTEPHADISVEVAVLAIGVGLPFRESGRDQPARAGPPEIGEGAFDIRKRQMHQTVPAQDRVAFRQWIAGDIGEAVFARDLSGGGARLQALDQRRHDVHPDQAHAQISMIDPAGVAAGRVEQRRDAESLEQKRQFRA